jgi:hypothetical protein
MFGRTDTAQLDITFAGLAADPLPRLTTLVESYGAWGEEHWNHAMLRRRSTDDRWSPDMRLEADQAAAEHRTELGRIREGVQLLAADATMRKAFQLMNAAIGRAARGRYDRWRPFQVGFVLSVLPSLQDGSADRDIVETVWFATGGGKTETYLGLLVFAAFHDRLRGKRSGITAWSRFPLRLLSLQQTQRFADALAAAELVRRDQTIAGDPISLGYFIGAGATPNEIVEHPDDNHPFDVEDDEAPKRYQVLVRCSFCGQDTIDMRFNRKVWRLEH